MSSAADFAFRQALALCPNNPEVTEHYAAFLKQQNREADASLVQDLVGRFKPKTGKPSTSPEKSLAFQIRLVLDTPTDDSEVMTNEWQSIPPARTAEVLNLQKQVLLDQQDLQSARVITGNLGEPQVEFTLTRAGREKFAQVTREHLHQRLAIIVDGRLLTAPNIQSEITSGTAQITGNFNEAEARALAAKLNAAAQK
jgi:preprotein translocase subunit SecD